MARRMHLALPAVMSKTMTRVAGLSRIVGLALVALLGAGSVAAETREDGTDTIDACTEPSVADCFDPAPDCQDLCGPGYCAGAGCVVTDKEHVAVWICCPRGYTAGWDDARAVWVCVGSPVDCPDETR